MNSNRLSVGLLAFALIAATLWGSGPALAQDRKLNVVATTTQVADAVRIVGGDKVTVTGLMGAGVDPHLYKATESDIAAMHSADIVFYSGLHLEGQFAAVFEALGERNIRTYAVSDPVRRAGFVLDAFDPVLTQAGTADPHFWFDPRNWQLAVTGVAEVLAELDPANADYYRANAEAYNAQLDKLFLWGLKAMTNEQIPVSQRVLVTSHDAFQYFGAAFGWKVRGLQGISTAAEASVRDVQELADFVFNQRIPVLFVESSVPRGTIEAVQEAVRAKARAAGIDFTIQVGERELFSDAMGDPGTFGGTYIGMVAQNILTILQSFGYGIPPWPEGLEPILPAELLAAG